MKNSAILLTGFISICSFTGLCAQTVSVTGTVKNSNGEYIKDAVVRLEGHPEISTITSSDGTFVLTGDITNVQDERQQDKCKIEGCVIKVFCNNEPLNIGFYSISGALVYKIVESGNLNGYFQYDINNFISEVGIYLVRINIGGNVFAYKYLNVQKNILNTQLYGVNILKSATGNDGVDYIEITHDQYNTKEIAINSYTEDLGDIVLESNVTVPNAPTNFVAESASSSQIDLTWTDNSDNETGFIIELGIQLSNGAYLYSELETVGSNVTSFQHTGLSAGTTYKYRICAYNSAGKSAYVYASGTTEAESRSITLINNGPTSVRLTDIVQVKIAATENNVYTRSDLLTDDPAECLYLPGESIEPGESRKFDITIGPNYSVFIGMGCWDLNNVTCPLGNNWFKCRFFTTPDYDLYYVWVVVNVTGHESGDWEWTISGSYLSGTLNVKPAGNNPLYFNRTSNNPIQ